MKRLSNPLRQARQMTLATGFLVVLFWVFFDITKHNAALMAVGVFLEDPYDAVGSFGVQLAGLAAVLSLLRAFRPYTEAEYPIYQLSRILRCNAVALVSILVTLGADGIALLRFLPRWTAPPAGWALAAMLVGLAIATGLVSGWTFRLDRSQGLCSTQPPPSRRLRLRSWINELICLAAGLFLAYYPEAWHAGIAGAVGMALSGMFLLFLVTAAIIQALFPWRGRSSADLLDDLGAAYRWARERAGSAGFLFRAFEALGAAGWRHAILEWLNPRKRPWALLVVVALGMGFLLIFFESLGEGSPSRSAALLVFSVFVGIEGAGVVVGYLLFNRYLSIFRG